MNASSKVWAAVIKDGRNVGHHAIDLLRKDGELFAVLEWLESSQGDIPSVKVRLDLSRVHEINAPQAKFLYEFPITWPGSAGEN